SSLRRKRRCRLRQPDPQLRPPAVHAGQGRANGLRDRPSKPRARRRSRRIHARLSANEDRKTAPQTEMSAGPLVLEAADLAATETIGRRLGERLFPGAVIGLIGPLGAGKTCLVRSIVAGLGGDPRQVSSPTFALIHEYAARLPVYHFDTYRLPNERAFVELG